MVALKNFYELVPSGGVVAFDEIGNEKWIGESIAFKEFFNKKSIKLKKFEFDHGFIFHQKINKLCNYLNFYYFSKIDFSLIKIFHILTTQFFFFKIF